MQKTYQYNERTVQNKILSVLKKRHKEATVADIISATTFPEYQVSEQLKAISTKYQGHLQVTEQGELLYTFPNGFREKKLTKFVKNVLQKTGVFLKKAFKVWTAVMLVGYMVLFSALLILAVVASFAISMSGRDNNRSRGGSMMLVPRVFDLLIRIWFWRSITGANRYSRYQRKGKKPGKPLYKTVFSFLFGEENEPDWEKAERKHIINFLRKKKGIITTEEFQVLTGDTKEHADERLMQFCLDYNGEPLVSDAGSLYYAFPELLKTTDSSVHDNYYPEQMPLKKFSENKSNANVGIGLVNTFNILFSSYFMYFSLLAPPLSTPIEGQIGFEYLYRFVREFIPYQFFSSIVLGIIPFTYSLLFFIVPAVRAARLKKENQRRLANNYRKRVFDYIYTNPDNVQSMLLAPRTSGETPNNWQQVRDQAVQQIGDTTGMIVTGENQTLQYQYPDFQRKKEDIKKVRNTATIEKLGPVIYDTNE